MQLNYSRLNAKRNDSADRSVACLQSSSVVKYGTKTYPNKVVVGLLLLAVVQKHKKQGFRTAAPCVCNKLVHQVWL